jgi:hypothetical protein
LIDGVEEQELEHKVKDYLQTAATQNLEQCKVGDTNSEWGKTAHLKPYFTAD